MSEELNNRTIAIVGRPNVGKSALFNRLVGRRIAIVHEQSGVTRDRLVCDARWKHEPFTVIDTGGIGYIDGSQPEDVINEGIVDQAAVAIEDASIILFVVDTTAGILPLDESVAKYLHDSGRKVFLLANKADDPSFDLNVVEFEKLGFPTFSVSAEHNRGLDAVLKVVCKEMPPPDKDYIRAENPLKVAIVGRPNAGKSSYINRLIKNERIIVSDVAGTTRDAIDVPFTMSTGKNERHYLLIDTAGMRKKTKIKDTVESFSTLRTERSIRRADVVILMMDAETGPTDRDKKLSALIKECQKGCIIMVNKWDLAQEQGITQKKYGEALRESLPFLNHVPVIFGSALSGYNLKNTVEAIDYVAGQVSTKISTGVLNRILRDAFDKTPPPFVKSLRCKLFYCTQISTNPIRIRLFVNDPKRMPQTYEKFLENTLRKNFGLEGAPIVLQCTARPKKEYD